MARLFFRKPQLAILDEATNATSVDIEDLLYSVATDSAKMGMTCVTISQRPALVRYHTRELQMKDGKGDWVLVRLPAARYAMAYYPHLVPVAQLRLANVHAHAHTEPAVVSCCLQRELRQDEEPTISDGADSEQVVPELGG